MVTTMNSWMMKMNIVASLKMISTPLLGCHRVALFSFIISNMSSVRHCCTACVQRSANLCHHCFSSFLSDKKQCVTRILLQNAVLCKYLFNAPYCNDFMCLSPPALSLKAHPMRCARKRTAAQWQKSMSQEK